MNTDLRKRLEEAAEKLYPYKQCQDKLTEHLRNGVIELLRKSHIAGAELGYKEAIKVAKEWFGNYLLARMRNIIGDGIAYNSKSIIGGAIYGC